MSVEAWTITPEYTISGTGPYSITHPYVVGAIRAYVQLGTGRLQLNGTEFAVSPEASEVAGNLTLSPTAAATHAGLPLIIDRVTPDEQGWLAVLGEREAGLAAQLDRMVQAQQELRAELAGALRIRDGMAAFDWAEGTVPVIEGGQVKSGPTAAAIAAAQADALAANQAKIDAQAARDEALAKENSMLRDRGVWGTGILYSPSDIFSYNDGGGSRAYITQTAHLATTIAADLAALRIRIFVDRGAPGAGTGDVLAINAGSEYAAAAATFRSNIGLGGLAVKTLAAFADIDPSAVITDVETLAANKLNNAFATAKAVTDYVDPLLRMPLADKVVTGAPVGSIDFTELDNSNYLFHYFQLINVKPTNDGTDLGVRFSSNLGISWDAGSTDYPWQLNRVAGGSSVGGGSASSFIALTFSNAVGNASTEDGVTGDLTLVNAADNGKYTRLLIRTSFDDTGSGLVSISGSGRRSIAQDTTAVRFFMTAGNIAVGSRIRMYGHN